MNRLSTERRSGIIACLIKGNSIVVTSRKTGVAKNTVAKMLLDVGEACAAFQYKTLRDLACKRVHCFEIWSFGYRGAKDITIDERGQVNCGDVWTWTAICKETRLAVSWLVGNRDTYTANLFIKDVASRLKGDIQLETHRHKIYLASIPRECSYIPGANIRSIQSSLQGNSHPKQNSVKYNERQPFAMRIKIDRSNPQAAKYEKKINKMANAVSLHFMYYNFARVHQTLRVTPAMKAGVTDHIWDFKEIAQLTD